MPHELMHSPPPPIGLLRMIEAELKKEANRQLQLLKEQAMAKVAEIINQVPYLIYIPPKTFQIDKEHISKQAYASMLKDSFEDKDTDNKKEKEDA